jgi:hypothetical protein
MHWTQTPKGRKIMAANARARHRAGGFSARPARSTRSKTVTRRPRAALAPSTGLPNDTQVAFALGHITSWITAYSSSQNLIAGALAERVGALLRGEEVR